MYTVKDNFGKTCTLPPGSTVGDAFHILQPEGPYPFVLAMVNNDMCDFQTALDKDAYIEWILLNTREANQAYQRTLVLLLVRATKEILPEADVIVEHSLGKALYCDLRLERPITPDDVRMIRERMCKIRDEDPEIEKSLASRKECLIYARKEKRIVDYEILSNLSVPNVTYYHTGQIMDYYFGPMLPSFSCLTQFDVNHYAPGFLLRFPDADRPDELPPYVEIPKFAKVFLEAGRWGRILDCAYVTHLNGYIKNGEIEELIDIAEALQDKKRAEIADFIVAQRPPISMILIAGPSSAGKTTFTKRLCTQLRVNGKRPLMISLDDYFVDREHTPVLPDGSYDFESINALDRELFSQQILDLYAGKEINLPEFDFKEGQRVFRREPVKLAPGSPLVVEGLHALNDELSRVIPRYSKVKIYLGALTQLAINDHNRISTSDTRLIRRLVRDYQFRGHGAEETFAMWEGVRRGEETNIFPFQEDADVIFNSALIYELPVLKTMAEPLLKAVSRESTHFHLANRLLRFLSPFTTLDKSYVPEKSILREFIGY